MIDGTDLMKETKTVINDTEVKQLIKKEFPMVSIDYKYKAENGA
jgi:hypothetical protein